MKRLAVFASGNGTNFEAIASACATGEIAAEVALVVCDKAGAFVEQRAKNRGVRCFTFAPKSFAAKADYERVLVRLLDEAQIDLVCLAGYMRIVGETLLAAYGGRIINIHPSMLPLYKGAHAIEQSFESGRKIYGVTIHRVDASLDGGEIIDQRAVEYGGESVEELETLIHQTEHKLYVETINKLLKNESTF